MPRRTNLVIVGVALGVALLAVAGVLILGNARQAGTSTSRGEAIFQGGVDANGVPIPRRAASDGGMMGGGMMSRGCATCHGSDGRGRSTPMFSAPGVTYRNLTDPRGMLEPDGARGPTFTDVSLRAAVTRGVDPDGGDLEWPMPRWQLTDPQWGDLLAYLKQLE